MKSETKKGFSDAAKAAFVALFIVWKNRNFDHWQDTLRGVGFRDGHLVQFEDGSIDDKVLAWANKVEGASKPDVQAWIFARAKVQIANELDEEMKVWDFKTLLMRFEEMYNKVCSEARSPTRAFFTHYMGKPGSCYRVVAEWSSGEGLMLTPYVHLIFRTIKKWRDGTLELVSEQDTDTGTNKDLSRGGGKKQPPSESSSVAVAKVDPTDDFRRSVVAHGTTLFQSFSGLLIESGVTHQDVSGSAKILMRGAIKEIARIYGIKIQMLESEDDQREPLTRRDLRLDIPNLPKRK